MRIEKIYPVNLIIHLKEKKMISRILNVFLAVALTTSPVFAQQVDKSTRDDQSHVEVTIYNSNVGLVKDQRKIALPNGVNELRFMGVASTIQPETVYIQSLNQSENFRILEQNYEYDLMNSNKILDKYIGKDVKLVNRYFDEGRGDVLEKTTTAKLLSNNNNDPIYEVNGEIHLGHPGYKILPSLPENLIAKPTLTWMYQNKSMETHDIEVSYLASGLNWKSDYVVVLNKEDNEIGLNGWVTLDNHSGTTYNNAKLKLVAGDVNRVQQHQPRHAKAMMMRGAVMEMDMAAPQFEENSFFEYHIYDLQRPTTIKNNQKKQVSLLEAFGVKAKKQFIVKGQQGYYWSNYGSSEMDQPVEVTLEFENKKSNELGMPLPAGIMRLYKEDHQGSLQFIGEDRIKHTPKDEKIKLKIGDAFDVTAKRNQTDYKQINRRTTETAWEVTLHNHKNEDIVVSVTEPLHGDWRVLNTSHDYEKKDAFHVKFDVPVKKDQKVTLSYRVQFNH